MVSATMKIKRSEGSAKPNCAVAARVPCAQRSAEAAAMIKHMTKNTGMFGFINRTLHTFAGDCAFAVSIPVFNSL